MNSLCDQQIGWVGCSNLLSFLVDNSSDTKVKEGFSVLSPGSTYKGDQAMQLSHKALGGGSY